MAGTPESTNCINYGVDEKLKISLKKETSFTTIATLTVGPLIIIRDEAKIPIYFYNSIYDARESEINVESL